MINLAVLPVKEFEKNKKLKKFTIQYAFHPSPFGKCLIGCYKDSICHLSFVNCSESKNLDMLKKEWLGAELVHEKNQTGKMIEKVFKDVEKENFKVLLKGTHFEEKVWRELLKIEKGTTWSYEKVAVNIGKKNAVRAVASAVAKNSVCFLVPCHRVIRKNGDVHKYAWGSEIKKKLLQFENCALK